MKIGILKCGQSPEVIRDEVGDYDDMFRRTLAGRGFDFATWHVEAMQFPDSIHDAEGWLLTGSRHGAYEDHAFIPVLEDFIRRAYVAHVPLIGICFGHQIIAQALGGKVEKFAGGWAVGAQDYTVDGEKVVMNAWHQDQVTMLPPDARIAGTNEFCAYAALIYGDRAFTVQAHPEFDDRIIDGLMTHRAGAVPPDLVAAARARRGQADSRRVLDRIEAFLKAPRAQQPPAETGTETAAPQQARA